MLRLLMFSNDYLPTQAIYFAVKSEADQILSAQRRTNIVGPDETCRDAIVMNMPLGNVIFRWKLIMMNHGI
jgi:hypothetical protein